MTEKKRNITKTKTIKNFITTYKIGKDIAMSGDTQIKKLKFNQHKSPISIGNVDINTILVSNKVPFHKNDFKYFNNYTCDRKVKLLCAMLPKMSACKRDVDETK